MEKIRLFATAHKGLRNILCQFSTLLGNTDFSNQDELERLNKMAVELFILLEDHVKVEEELILTPLEARAPGTTNHDHNDHIKIEKKQRLLQQKLIDLFEFPTQEKGYKLYLDFTRFQSIYLNHIYHEEVVTEQQLWQNFDNDELLNIRQSIIKSMSSEMLLLWWKYIIPAQQISIGTEMLSILKRNSNSLFNDMLEMLESNMETNKYDALCSQLTSKKYHENGVL